MLANQNVHLGGGGASPISIWGEGGITYFNFGGEGDKRIYNSISDTRSIIFVPKKSCTHCDVIKNRVDFYALYCSIPTIQPVTPPPHFFLE